MLAPQPIRDAFLAAHSVAPRLFVAPGRVNLIGEHTDYNGGFVLPMAIDRGVVVAAAPLEQRRIVADSALESDPCVVDLDAPGTPRPGTWGAYVEGVARELDRHLGGRLQGARLHIEGDLPAGAGLSSSAALQVATTRALAALSGATLEPLHLARLVQRAEQTWVGTQCGIMDPMAVTFGRRGHALHIDCRSLEHTLVPLPSDRARVVLCDTGVTHALASSAYNDRRRECEEAADALKAHLPNVASLRDVDPATFQQWAHVLPEPLRRRARHVVTENARVQQAARALASGDLPTMGALMHASHRSLRDDFEVSCPELDHAVDTAARIPGVHGSRMTGGGFGGCTVHLVAPHATDALTDALAAAHGQRFGRAPSIFTTTPCEGAHELPALR
jgi:galactokinase